MVALPYTRPLKCLESILISEASNYPQAVVLEKLRDLTSRRPISLRCRRKKLGTALEQEADEILFLSVVLLRKQPHPLPIEKLLVIFFVFKKKSAAFLVHED